LVPNLCVEVGMKNRYEKHTRWARGLLAGVLWLQMCVGFAEAEAGELVGKVTDPQGKPIAGARLYLVDTIRGIERSSITDPTGHYRIASLSPGEYLWQSFCVGYRTLRGRLSLPESNQPLTHDLELPSAQEYRLENEKLLLVIDENGTVRELRNKQVDASVNYVSGQAPGFWHIVFRRGECWENVVLAEAQQYQIEKPAQNRLVLRVDRLRFRQETFPVTIQFSIQLHEDELSWAATVENRAELEITEFYFPELGGVRSLGGKSGKEYLYWPNGLGERMDGFASRTLRMTYPWPASMAWFTVCNGQEGIYCGAHDDSFLSSELQVGPNPLQANEPTLGFVKFPFIRPGETWTSKPYVVACYKGTWHTAADKYRRWMHTWRKTLEKPAWVQRTTGMFLVILKQQYGDIMWHYDEIPLLYEEAQRNGINMVALFGWTQGGHDNQYPQFLPDPKMGGAEVLRRALQQVRASGGHVVCYMQGRLLDAQSEYVQSPEGQKVVARNLWGGPYVEEYNKYYHSSLLRLYSRKLQMIANPIHPEWRTTLLEKAQEVIQHGPNGILFDQIGGLYAYPAFDTPPEIKPTLAFPEGQQKLLAFLRTQLKQKQSDFGLLSEHLTDVYSQYVDMLHGCGAGYAPGPTSFPAMARYVLPDVILTSRNPMPRLDARQVNFALAYGLLPELEVRYRNDASIIRDGVGAEKAEYLRKIGQLRGRYPELLFQGRYMDVLGVEASNPAVTVTSFESGRRRAVVAWNDTSSEQRIEVAMPGWHLVEVAGLEQTLPPSPQKLAPQEVAVWIFDRQTP